MKIFILTLFPEFFESPLQTSILGRAIADQKITIETINIRNYTLDKHKNVDDVPFG
ncbi:MAG: hypothetical protein U9Q15_05625 [Patescibacteria group bacterium]|nr:hypothetical protein [Patescibacteria group bacterium]